MQNIAIILAVLIFSQSLSVCGTSFIPSHQKEVVAECKTDLALQSGEIKHSCCSNKPKSENTKDDSEKGCCGDSCKCFCHAKLFITEYSIIRKSEILVKAIAEKNILPVFVHSYDFHPSVSYPPQV